MNLKIKQDYCILVENYSEWIEIQKYLFSIDIQWSSTSKNKLFKIFHTGRKREEIIFPRYLAIDYFTDERSWSIYNTSNYKIETIPIPNNGPLIKASVILRKEKLREIEASK